MASILWENYQEILEMAATLDCPKFGSLGYLRGIQTPFLQIKPGQQVRDDLTENQLFDIVSSKVTMRILFS